VEQVRPLEQLCEPDERQIGFRIRDRRTGKYRRAKHEDLYSAATGISISPEVPEPIASQLEIAKALLVYSWYFYAFNVTACLQALLALEHALKYRARVENGSLTSLLAKAIRGGWFREDALLQRDEPTVVIHPGRNRSAKFKTSSNLKTLAAGLVYLRNRLAHGTHMLFPDGAGVVRICAELVNQLFTARL
jgi:hypothetical protein